MESLADIRLFAEAAELGSLSAAGSRLNLSPAAASARLTRLEARLQVRLFERTTRKLRLTDEGRLYLAHCKQALLALEDAHAALQVGRHVVRGKIRISATSDFGREVLMPWLREFRETHPDVIFSVSLTDSLANLQEDEIDLAIRFGIPAQRTLIAKPLANNRRILCAAPAYIARKGVPTEPGELENFDLLLRRTDPAKDIQWQFTREGVVTNFIVPSDQSHEANDGALIRQWALEGLGIAMKSIWDIHQDLQAGRLIHVLPEWDTPRLPVYAIFQRSRFMAPRVRSLLDFLEAKFSQEASSIKVSANSRPSSLKRSQCS
jgi:DNA-binding transcriptional LysR family regulator